MSSATTCVVADDHPAVLESVSRYLGIKGFRVVGRARNGEEAIALVESLRPALTLLDLRMPLLGGTGAVRRLARSVPQCSAVAYSGYADRTLLTEALDAGARGFVLKDAPLESLIRALETVVAGGMYIDASLADVVLHGEDGELRLTPRERDVLRLLADGHSNDSIGRELLISADTARAQLGAAMAKLGAATRTQAVAIALRERLIS
jgi:DNA-binding NarL/FixJ family response regulator